MRRKKIIQKLNKAAIQIQTVVHVNIVSLLTNYLDKRV